MQTGALRLCVGACQVTMGCILSSPRTSAVDPTVQVSPATKMGIKDYLILMQPPSMWPLRITFRMELGHWRGPRGLRSGSRIRLCSQLCSLG